MNINLFRNQRWCSVKRKKIKAVLKFRWRAKRPFRPQKHTTYGKNTHHRLDTVWLGGGGWGWGVRRLHPCCPPTVTTWFNVCVGLSCTNILRVLLSPTLTLLLPPSLRPSLHHLLPEPLFSPCSPGVTPLTLIYLMKCLKPLCGNPSTPIRETHVLWLLRRQGFILFSVLYLNMKWED